MRAERQPTSSLTLFAARDAHVKFKPSSHESYDGGGYPDALVWRGHSDRARQPTSQIALSRTSTGNLFSA